MNALSIIHPVLALLLAPLLLGVINRIKAVFAGRTGQPLLQAYYDLLRLLRKGVVYSRTTTWIFRAGPVIGLASVLVALAVVPFGNISGSASFRRRPASAGLCAWVDAIFHSRCRPGYGICFRRNGREPRGAVFRYWRSPRFCSGWLRFPAKLPAIPFP